MIRLVFFLFLMVLTSCASMKSGGGSSEHNTLHEQECMSWVRAGDFDRALSCFQDKDEGDVALTPPERLAYAICLDKKGRTGEALDITERLVAEHDRECSYVYYHATFLARTEQWEEAKLNYKHMLSLQPKNQKWVLQAEAYLRNVDFLANYWAGQNDHSMDDNWELQKLPQTINSDYPAYGPSLSVDGREIIFTRKLRGQEDLYYCRKDADGDWGISEPLEVLNTVDNEGAHCLSAEGDVLIYTRCGEGVGLGSCDLFISFKDEHGWSVEQNLGSAINTPYWESQPSLSADGSYLFFVSNRPGGYGGRDIWVVHRQSNGEWSRPINAGNSINTPGDESTPFIHADGRSLFFSSDYWPGFGGLDVFVTRSLGQGQWSEPQNLGHHINNERDNAAIFIDGSGKNLFMHHQHISPESNKEMSHIYSGVLENIDWIPKETMHVRLWIRDAKTGKAIPGANVHLNWGEKEDKETRRTDGQGSILIAIKDDQQELSIQIQAPGYLYHSAQRVFDGSTSTSEEILLYPLSSEGDTSEAVVLNHILFASGSADLLPSSMEELRELVQFWTTYGRGYRMEIMGHTDDVGSAEDNQILSEARAATVKKALVDMGIEIDKLTAKGYGERMPIVDNSSEEGRKQNRRTAFRLIKIAQQ